MKKVFYILFVLGLIPLIGLSQQARINITAGYMKIGVTNFSTLDAAGTNHSKTTLVVDDSASTALLATAGSGIISSGEFNMIVWNIGQSSAGTFILPWMSDNHTSIPLNVTINTHATNNATGLNASVAFSTWHTPSDNSNGLQSLTGLPMDVTNMDAAYPGRGAPTQTDNSYNVVDRFWVIDDQSTLLPSGTKKFAAGKAPTMTLGFTYLGVSNSTSEVGSPNVFADGQLMAQRFNSTKGTWSDYTPGTPTDANGASTSLLTTLSVASANWFRSWALSNVNSPMPIQLLSFNAECHNYEALLEWSTATETNNSYFTVDRSTDGLTYQTIAVVKGAGNSSTNLDYSTTDDSPLLGTSYYRLSQTDFDGNNVIVSTIVYTPCEGNANTINAYWAMNYMNVQINSVETSSTNYTITLCNALGQTVYSDVKTIVPGNNEFKLNTNVAEGVYFLTATNGTNIYHKKILIKR